MRPTARHLARPLAKGVAVWLAVGASFSLLVAWLRGFITDGPVPYTRQIDLRADLRWLDRSMPAEMGDALRLDGIEYAWRSDGRRADATRIGEESTSFLFWRYGADGRPDRTPAGTGHVRRIRRGWPLPCVEGSAWSAGNMAEPVRRSMVSIGAGASAIEIPVGVLPFGLAVDAAFWGGLFHLMLLLPTTAERLVRRRRGLCTACAYPLHGQPRCPECGAICSAGR